MIIPSSGEFTFLAQADDAGKRLDTALTHHLSNCTRSFAANLIRKGEVTVQGILKKPGYRVQEGDAIAGRFPPSQPIALQPEPIDIDILYEDEDLVVINKQPGLVVHPAPGHHGGTLVNALLYHCSDLKGIGGELRPGIVHRLDKDTSGVLVAAKNDATHVHLSTQFKSRTIKKTYLAFVHGDMETASGTIALSVGRHPVLRKKMSTQSRTGRKAETRWQALERFDQVTLLELQIKTGRTHQIRVHCAAIDHPVVGDPVYGRRTRKKGESKNAAAQLIRTAPRQMLHAWRLGFVHPGEEKRVSFEAPIPSDMQALLDALRNL